MSKKNSTGATSAPVTSRREMLRQQQEQQARQQRTMRIIGVGAAVLALVLVAVVGTVLWNNHKNKVEAVSAQGTPAHANADKSGITVFPGKAKQGAPVVSLYLDYQCPNCKHAEKALGPVLESLANKGEIDLEYRTMIFMDVNLANDASKRAAIAAACADNAGVYAAYHDGIFENQAKQEIRGSEGYSNKLLTEDLPAKVGLSGQKLADFKACYTTKATEAFVKGTDDKAGRSGVTGTPTLQVNGKKVDFGELGTTEDSVLKAIKAAA